MADIETRNPYRQAQFTGIDNRNPETKVRPGYVRDMVNVDPTRDGQMPARRLGRDAPFYVGSRVHSAWGDGAFPWLVFVDSDVLYGKQSRDDAPVPLRLLTSDEPMSYAQVNSELYFSNGTDAGVLRIDGEAHPWACEAPAGQSTLVATPNGGMPAGAYQVAITYRDVLGRESGTGRAAVIAVPAGGGIALNSLPQPADIGVVTVRIYVTEVNGEVLYHAGDIPRGMLSAHIAHGPRKMPLRTQFQTPLPPGHLVGVGHGRLFVARGRTVFWSDTLRYGQGVLADNTYRVGMQGDSLDLLAPVADGMDGAGVYVAAGQRTYWLGGADPKDWRQVMAYPAGVVAGTLAWASGEVWGLDSRTPVPSWLARNGQFCVGLPGGQIVSYNADTAATEGGEYGASLIRDANGQRHMVTTLRGPTAGAAVGDQWSVEVRRNGVLLP